MIRGWNPIRGTVASPSSSLVSYMDQIEGPRDLTEVISEQLREVQLAMPGVTEIFFYHMLACWLWLNSWGIQIGLRFIRCFLLFPGCEIAWISNVGYLLYWSSMWCRSATTFLSSLAGRLFRTLVQKVRIVKDPATEISDCDQWRIGSTHIHTLSIPRVHGARWDQHQILKYTIPSVTETVWTRHPNRDVLAFCINKHKIQSIILKTIHIILLFK